MDLKMGYTIILSQKNTKNMNTRKMFIQSYWHTAFPLEMKTE